jgi:hypothetical protein
LRIADVNMLENVTEVPASHIGSRVSPTKIAATLKSQGKSIDQKNSGSVYSGPDRQPDDL